jgi:hypothetical protein
MRHVTLVLATTLLAAGTSQTEETHRVRYDDPSGRVSLTVSQDIEVVREPPVVASRDFSFDLTLAADDASAAVTVTVDRAKGSYVAHEMKQRLGTRHLAGRSFSLSIAATGRWLEATEPSESAEIDLGPVVVPGFSIVEALSDALPVLPETAVAVGTTWMTERPLRSLEGWTWATGFLTSRHRVTAVDRQKAHTVVTVATEAKATLVPVDDERPGSADLERTLSWTFDATDGRLLSLSSDQTTEGRADLGRGEIPVYQRTRVELTAGS